jgi:hypothetical protein
LSSFAAASTGSSLPARDTPSVEPGGRVIGFPMGDKKLICGEFKWRKRGLGAVDPYWAAMAGAA